MTGEAPLPGRLSGRGRWELGAIICCAPSVCVHVSVCVCVSAGLCCASVTHEVILTSTHG